MWLISDQGLIIVDSHEVENFECFDDGQDWLIVANLRNRSVVLASFQTEVAAKAELSALRIRLNCS